MAKKKKTAKKTTGLPEAMTIQGEGYTPPDANIGGGPRVANRDGIFVCKATRPKDKWFVEVKEKPGEWNLAFTIETVGPSDYDKGFKKTTYQNVSSAYKEGAKRAGQSRMHWIRDLLSSAGVPDAKIGKLVPVSGKANLVKLNALLDKYVQDKEVFAKLLARQDRTPYKGEYHCSTEVWGLVPKEAAELKINEKSHEQPLSPVVRKYVEEGPKRADDDGDLDGEDEIEETEDDEDTSFDDDDDSDDSDDEGDDDDDDLDDD